MTATKPGFQPAGQDIGPAGAVIIVFMGLILIALYLSMFQLGDIVG